MLCGEGHVALLFVVHQWRWFGVTVASWATDYWNKGANQYALECISKCLNLLDLRELFSLSSTQGGKLSKASPYENQWLATAQSRVFDLANDDRVIACIVKGYLPTFKDT